MGVAAGKSARRGRKRSLGRRLLLGTALILFLAVSFGAGFGLHFFLQTKKGLPDVNALKVYRPSLITTVYSDSDEVIGKFFIEKRVLVPFSEIPDLLTKAFIAIEDARFYQHHGIDLQGISRAFWANLRAKQITQGGSTITQQLAKTLFLSPERTLRRKLREALLALEIEKHFSKDEILELYLNQIYFGEGAYGVEAAAETYFGKQVGDLTLAEMAVLAALPKSPTRFDPFKHPNRSRARHSLVLNRMYEEHFITLKQRDAAEKESIRLRPKRKSAGESAYFLEQVRRDLMERYGSRRLYRSGLEVHTTLNLAMQKAAVRAVRKGLLAYDRRHGYRGPLGRVPLEEVGRLEQSEFLESPSASFQPIPLNTILEGTVLRVGDRGGWVLIRGQRGFLPFSGMKWARRSVPAEPGKDPDQTRWIVPRQPGDVISPGDRILVRVLSFDPERSVYRLALEQEPEVQGALVAMDPATGEIKAMVGGYDFEKSEFNRAVQARRQPGSAFKPIIYGAAIEKGFSPASVIIDTPIIFEDPTMTKKWKPANYSEKFYGPTRLRVALAKSRNVVTVKLLRKIGIRKVVGFARRLGIQSPLNQDYSLALGSSGLSLLELVSAYSVFDNHGMRAKPFWIRDIRDYDGKLIEENRPATEPAIDPQVAYIVTNMLEDVVRSGTGRRMQKLGRPSAGKTGTTNNFLDALYIGYVPDLVTGVWVGYDDMRSLGKYETGARAASPIWLAFMKEALKGHPRLPFVPPPQVEFVKVEKKSGLLPSAGGQETYFECFRMGHAPREYAPVKSVRDVDFFDLDSNALRPDTPVATPDGGRDPL